MTVEVTFDASNDHIQIKGELTSKTVEHALVQFTRECKSLSSWVIDFTQVSKVDSTAIALIIELKRDAMKKDRKISFIALPEALLTIARLSQVDGLLTETS